MLKHAVAYKSNIKYAQDWKRWRSFLAQCWEDPSEEECYMQNLPKRQQIELLIAYGMHCVSRESKPLAACTVISSFSGIRHSFRSNMLDMDFFDDRAVRAFKTAISLEERKRRADNDFTAQSKHKFPLTLGMVTDMVNRSRERNDVKKHMTAAAIQMAFMWVSEFAPNAKDDANDCCHAILTRDVNFEIQRDDGTPVMVNASQVTAQMWPRVLQVRFTLRHMKNDKFRMGNTFWYINQVDAAVNIAQVAFDWAVRAKRGHHGTRDFFFSYTTLSNRTSLLSRHMVSKTIKDCARRFGLDHRDYGTHSPRIGGACTLRAGGASQSYLAEMGRWAEGSSAILTYQETSQKEMAAMQRILQDATLFTTRDIREIHKNSSRISYSFSSLR